VEEVKIRSGTRVKLKHVDEDVLPQSFVIKAKEYAHKDERILAVYFFAIQVGDQDEQPSMAVAIKAGMFKKQDEVFLQVVDEIQMILPEDLSINLYRFGAAELLTKYCVENLEPIYLRSQAWLDKQRKKYLK
jgi:hypothetical protein